MLVCSLPLASMAIDRHVPGSFPDTSERSSAAPWPVIQDDAHAELHNMITTTLFHSLADRLACALWIQHVSFSGQMPDAITTTNPYSPVP